MTTFYTPKDIQELIDNITTSQGKLVGLLHSTNKHRNELDDQLGTLEGTVHEMLKRIEDELSLDAVGDYINKLKVLVDYDAIEAME